MKKIIQNTLFLIIAILFQVSCDNLMKQTKENKINLFDTTNPVTLTFWQWFNCQLPGAINIARAGTSLLLCYTEKVDSGLIFNYATQDKITVSELNFDSGIKLFCGCKWGGSGDWYKSPVSNPSNGQKLDLILENKDQPLNSYSKGDLLYCLPSSTCREQGFSGYSKYQKIAIK